QLPARLQLVAEPEQHDARIRPRDAQLQPALLVVERLVGQQPEAQHLRVEGQSTILVRHRNADELDASNHASQCPSAPRLLAISPSLITIVMCTISRSTIMSRTSSCPISSVTTSPRRHFLSIWACGSCSSAQSAEP